MKIIDLTHLIEEDMSLYIGTEKPKLIKTARISTHNYNETEFTFNSHIGTHMDAPSHIFDNTKSLDQFDINQFVGLATCVDCTKVKDKVTLETLLSNKNIDKVDFLLFRFDYDKYWKQEIYSKFFPVFDKEVIEYISKLNLKGIGIDTISVDTVEDFKLPTHQTLLKNNNFIIIENLCNLSKIDKDIFMLYALPLKYIDSDGAQSRVIACIDDTI